MRDFLKRTHVKDGLSETMRFLIPIFISLLILSCEGPEGTVGPAGPQGERGEDGNANVATFTVVIDPDDYSPYTSTITGNILWDEAVYVAPEITADVAENGAVIGYWGRSALWTILPDLGIGFSYRPGEVEVNIDRISGISFVDALSGVSLRFIVIYPPAAGKLKNVNITDYEAVMEVLGER